jgi:VWFA-related protein
VVFLDELAPADQVGLLVLPTGARHDLSVDRTAVRAALQRVTGASTQLNDCAPTLGEAAAIEAGDSRGGRAHADRTKSLGCQAAMGQTRLTLALRRRSTQLVLDEMVRSAEAMAHLEGRKAIVLLSEGLFMDSEIRDVWRDVVAVAARSSVVVYAVHLGFPLTEAGLKGQTTTTRLLDDQYGFDGMAEAASSAGGRAVRAIASAKPALQLLDTELSGYYLLSFRRDPDDEPGKRIKIVVKMKQPGFDVRFRQSFTPGPRLSK